MATADPENMRLFLNEPCSYRQSVQNRRETDDEFLIRLSGASLFCKFSEFNNTADAEDEMIRIKFISGLRSADCNLKLIEPSKIKTDKSLLHVKADLQFSDQAQHFAGLKLKIETKEEITNHSKSTLRKLGNVEKVYNGN